MRRSRGSRRSRPKRRSGGGWTPSANAVRSSAAAPAATGTDSPTPSRMTEAADDIVLPLPPNAPRVKPSAFARWLGRTVLRLGGWRMEGAFPDIPKLVLIGAPHSSNWDGVWGFAAKLALGLDLKVLGKHQLFWWPLGVLMRGLGVIAVDRSAAAGVVEQAAALLRTNDKFWFGLAPEGTRKPVERW